MSNNNSSITTSAEDGVRGEETFHIYVLSFAYGLMVVS